MSGPKCVGYRVTSSAELRRRALEVGRRQLTHLLDRVAELAALASAMSATYGVTVAAPAGQGLAKVSDHDLLDVVASLERSIAADQGRIEDAQSHARNQAATVAVLGMGRRAETAARLDASDLAASHTPTPSGTGPDPRQERAMLISRALSRVPALATESEAASAVSLAEEALGADSPQRADLLGRALQDNVSALLQTCKHRAEAAERVTQLELRIAALPPEHTEKLQRDLASAAARPPDVATAAFTDVERSLSDLESLVTRLQDQRFALAVTAECLEELGYELGETFASLADGQPAMLRRADWPGYGVQLRSSPDRGDIGLNVVRTASLPGDPVRDLEIEEAFCQDVAVLLAAASDRGVAAQLRRALPAGTLPLQVVPDEVLRRGRSTSSGQNLRKEQGAGS